MLGAAGAVAPLPALIVLSGAGVVLLAIAAPRTMVGLTALAVLFVRPLEHLVLVAEVSYLDEALIAVCAVTLPLRRLATRQALRTFPGQWWFVGFAAAGLLSGLFLDVPPSVYLMGAVVVCKGMIFAWAVAQVDWVEQHLANAARVGVAVIVLALIATAVNLAIPGAWVALLASDLKASAARSFLPSVIGPFSAPARPRPVHDPVARSRSRVAIGGAEDPAHDGADLIATAVGSRVERAPDRDRQPRRGLGVDQGEGARRRGAPRRRRVRSRRARGAGRAPRRRSVHVHLQRVRRHPGGSPAARTVLTVDSFDVAADHFPAGAGFGRFGSAIAATTYSPEYLKRGYQDVWGLGRTAEEGRFLTDTEWPAVIGETGFLGAIAFALGLVAIYRAGSRLWTSRRAPVVRWAGLLTIGWLIACLVQSIATVSFTGPPVYALFFGLVGVVAALSRQPEAISDETALDEAGKRREPTPTPEVRPVGQE